MTTAVIHIGLPKTGTTSFQIACRQHADDLAKRGVLYPTHERFMFPGAALHQALALRIAKGTEASIDDDVRELSEMAKGYRTLLLSAERFAVNLNSAQNEAPTAAFRDALVRRFDQVLFVCTIRSDRALLASALREKLEARGMPQNGAEFVRNHVETFYRANRRIAELFAGRLRILRFEDLVARQFPDSLLEACTGLGSCLPVLKTNASVDKDARRLLMSAVRMALFNYFGDPTPFSPRIEEAYQKLLSGVTIAPETGAELSRIVDDWMNRELDAATADCSDSLEAIYEEFLGSAADR